MKFHHPMVEFHGKVKNRSPSICEKQMIEFCTGSFVSLVGLYFLYIGLTGLSQNRIVYTPFEHFMAWIDKTDASRIMPWENPKRRGILSLVFGLVFALMGLFLAISTSPTIKQLDSKVIFFWFDLLTFLGYAVFVPLVLRSTWKKKYILGIWFTLPCSVVLFLITSKPSRILALEASLWVFMAISMIAPMVLSYIEDMDNYRNSMREKSGKS